MLLTLYKEYYDEYNSLEYPEGMSTSFINRPNDEKYTFLFIYERDWVL